MTDGDNSCQAVLGSAVIQHNGADGGTEIPEEDTTTAEVDPVATKESVCEFLSENSQIVFKSQQIDDPDLTVGEKQTIALTMYTESPYKFLLRFGKHLQEKHLKHFELTTKSDNVEMNMLIRDLKHSLRTHHRDVKNRRYAAMEAMIRANSYFSEREMMKREPHLYEQMVGQYLTDAEKRIRDRVDEDCEAFSRVLLDNYDKDEMEKLRKQQERDEISDDEDTNMSEKTARVSEDNCSMDSENLYPRVAASQRKQWGNFEDEEQPINQQMPGTSAKPRTNRKHEEKFITASEREMLRQEFIGIMYEKFLEGKDADFDYSAVDDNTELDDLEQIGQDSEDKYFDDDDDEDEGLSEKNMIRDDSEDELDVYMRNLNKQPTVMKQKST